MGKGDVNRWHGGRRRAGKRAERAEKRAERASSRTDRAEGRVGIVRTHRRLRGE